MHIYIYVDCEFGHTSMTKLNHCRLYQYLHPAPHQRLLFSHDKQRSKPYEHFEVSTAQQEGWTNQATNDVSRYGHVSNHLRTLFSHQKTKGTGSCRNPTRHTLSSVIPEPWWSRKWREHLLIGTKGPNTDTFTLPTNNNFFCWDQRWLTWCWSQEPDSIHRHTSCEATSDDYDLWIFA